MKGKNLATLYVWLFVIYLLSTSLLGSGFIITRIFSHILRIWSLFCLFSLLSSYGLKPAILKALGALLLMFVCYGLMQEFQDKVYYAHDPPVPITGSFFVFKICASLLPIFAFCYYAKRGYITDSFISDKIVLFLIVISIGAISNMSKEMSQANADEITNNFGYTYLSLMPMLVFVRSKLRQVLFGGICLIMILLCMKRGAIIISFMVVVVYMLSLLKSSSKSTKIKVLASMLLIFTLAFYAVNKMMSKSDYFQERVNDTMEGDSSGRDVYYAFFIDYYLNNTTDEEFLLGMGANATLGIWHNYAHNDWLEIAINQGLLGVFLYLIYWITFLKLCLKKRIEHKIKTALWIVFVIYFLQTFFSMSYSDYTLYSSIVLGYCIACSTKNNCKDTRLAIKTISNVK